MISTSGPVPIISIALPGDAEAMYKIATDAGIDAWSSKDYRAEMDREDSFVLVARLTTNEVAGFLVSRIVPGKSELPDADLYNIAVKAPDRRFGAGRELLLALISLLRNRDVENIWLEVRASNSGAIKFYSKYGFQPEITRRHFYSNPPEDAVIMRLKIGKGLDHAR